VTNNYLLKCCIEAKLHPINHMNEHLYVCLPGCLSVQLRRGPHASTIPGSYVILLVNQPPSVNPSTHPSAATTTTTTIRYSLSRTADSSSTIDLRYCSFRSNKLLLVVPHLSRSIVIHINHYKLSKLSGFIVASPCRGWNQRQSVCSTKLWPSSNSRQD